MGLDNLGLYYDIELKKQRLHQQGVQPSRINYNKVYTGSSGIDFINLDLRDREHLDLFFERNRFNIVVHLAAQAGVRFSLDCPFEYVENNEIGFLNLLEASKSSAKRILFASSSSIYGQKGKQVVKENDSTDFPISAYAATKKANECMAYVYHYNYEINFIAMRFFTDYGNWGRPDMALFKFTNSIINGIPISLFNNGNISRDYTHVNDISGAIAQIIVSTTDKVPNSFDQVNIGNGCPVQIGYLIELLEENIGKKAILTKSEQQPGDVDHTLADNSRLRDFYGYTPSTNIETGIKDFVTWCMSYYHKEFTSLRK